MSEVEGLDNEVGAASVRIGEREYTVSVNEYPDENARVVYLLLSSGPEGDDIECLFAHEEEITPDKGTGLKLVPNGRT